MSKKNVKNFYNIAKHDELLKKEFLEITQKYGNKGLENTNSIMVKVILDEIIKIAEKRGFIFSHEDLVEFINNEKSELSADELGFVAGGKGGLASTLLGISSLLFLGGMGTAPTVSHAMPGRTDIAQAAENSTDESTVNISYSENNTDESTESYTDDARETNLARDFINWVRSEKNFLVGNTYKLIITKIPTTNGQEVDLLFNIEKKLISPIDGYTIGYKTSISLAERRRLTTPIIDCTILNDFFPKLIGPKGIMSFVEIKNINVCNIPIADAFLLEAHNPQAPGQTTNFNLARPASCPPDLPPR